MAAVSQKEKDMIERRNREWDEAQRRKKARPVERKPSLAVKPLERFDFLKRRIKTWLKDRFQVADDLREIRDNELYKRDYDTFEQCCAEEFGLSRTYAYGLIEASEVKGSLAMSSIKDIVTTVGQARALAPVKESARPAVINRVVKSGEPVTAKAIREATKPRERKPKKKGPLVIDVTPEPAKTSAVKHCPTCTCGTEK
jgi:hypothetical protein